MLFCLCAVNVPAGAFDQVHGVAVHHILHILLGHAQGPAGPLEGQQLLVGKESDGLTLFLTDFPQVGIVVGVIVQAGECRVYVTDSAKRSTFRMVMEVLLNA